MGGLGKLSNLSKATIFEVARMSYGKYEGEKGGRGHIGLLDPGENRPLRIVKFDTHGGTSNEAAARRSSNDLRQKLMDIAVEAKLQDDVLTDIRQLLDLDRPAQEGEDQQPTNLLDRSIAAQVVEKIAGKRVWSLSHAKERAANGYASAKQTAFSRVSGANEDTSNVKTIDENNRLNEFGPDGGTVDDDELAMFGRIAHEHRDAEDFYVRFTPDGLNLESAGNYTPLRSLKAKRENNYVRQRLWDCVSDRFRGNIPASVKRVLPPLDGKGYPLSSDCIAQVIRAVFNAEIDRIIIRTSDQNLAERKSPGLKLVRNFKARLASLYPGIDEGLRQDAALRYVFTLYRGEVTNHQKLSAMLKELGVPENDERVMAWKTGKTNVAANSGIYRLALFFLSNKVERPTNAEIDKYFADLITWDQENDEMPTPVLEQGLTHKQTFALMVALCWDRTRKEHLFLDDPSFFNQFAIDENSDFVQKLKKERSAPSAHGAEGKIGLIAGAGIGDLAVIREIGDMLNKIKTAVSDQEIANVTKGSVIYKVMECGFDILAAMLPDLMEKARALQPKQPLTLQTLWTVLELDDYGSLPDLQTNEGAIAFCEALCRRIARDFPAYASNSEDFKTFIENLAKSPLKYEAFRNAMTKYVPPTISDFRLGWYPSRHAQNSKVAAMWGNEDNVFVTRDDKRQNKSAMRVTFKMNGEEVYTVGPNQIFGFKEIATVYHRQHRVSKKQAIVLNRLFTDYDYDLQKSLELEFKPSHDDPVEINVRPIRDEPDRLAVSVRMPYRTSEGGGALVHEYVLDEDGYLHDRGLHL